MPPKQQVPNPNVPGGPQKAFSSGMMEASFGFFGSAAAEAVGDPNVAQPIQNIGTNIATQMMNRWWKQEWENFYAEHGTPFKEQSMQLVAGLNDKFKQLNMGVYVDETGNTMKLDPTGEDASRIRDNLLGDVVKNFSQLNNNFMEAAMKYPANPYVNNAVQQLLQNTTQTINQITGPTPQQEREQSYAGTDLVREQAGYYSRMPAPSGSGSEKKKEFDPFEYYREHGALALARKFTTSPTAKTILGEHEAQAEIDYRNTLMNKTAEFKSNPDALTQAVLQGAPQISRRAITSWMADNIPQALDELQQSPNAELYIPQATQEPFRYTSDLPGEQKKEAINEAVNAVIQEMENVSLNAGSGISYEEVVDRAIENVLLPALNQQFPPDSQATPGAKRLKKDLKSSVISAVSNPSVIGGRSEVLRERFDIPIRSIFETTRERTKKGILDDRARSKQVVPGQM